MTIDLYSAFFDHAVFPVFALSDQGKIIYKNPSANKYLPMLRKNACVLKHFYPAEMPEESCVLRILGDTPYHIALALKDDNAFLALAFSRFQYEDGVPIACSLLSHYGSTASDFLCALQNEASSDYDRQSGRVYTDLLELTEGNGLLSSPPHYSFFEIISPLFKRLNHSFGALGYRIHTHIEKDFRSKAEVDLCLHNFLFLFGKLLYLQMRLSENGDVSISLSSDEKVHILRIRAKTAKIFDTAEHALLLAQLFHALPECEAEFSLIEKAGMLRKDKLHASIDACGNVTIEYHVPYVQNAKVTLQSTDFSKRLLTSDIDRFVLSLENLLKDNGASC